WLISTLCVGCETTNYGQHPPDSAQDDSVAAARPGVFYSNRHAKRSAQVCQFVPKESAKSPLPPYVVEPPDILNIDLLRGVPLPPHKLESLDTVYIRVTEAFPNEPIEGNYSVGPDGTIVLGASYGQVNVGGLTVDEARRFLHRHLDKILK